MLSLSTPSSPPPPTRPSTTAAPAAVSLLRGAAGRRDAPLTAALHAALLKSGALHSSQPLTASNSLLHAYVQCGLHSHALHLLDETPRRDAATYSNLISLHCRLGAPLDAFRAFVDMLAQDDGAVRANEFTVAALLQACGLAKDEMLGRMVHGYLVTNGFCADPFVVGSLINMYAKAGDVASARRLLLRSACRDVVSWTAVVSGCVLNGMLADALNVFVMMLEDGVLPNNVTMLSVIQACSLTGHSGLFSPVHALVVQLGLEDDVSVANSLIMMYAKNGLIEEAALLFEDLYPRRGSVCSKADVLGALIYGCTVSGSLLHGREIHAHLIKLSALPSISIENCLMGMYARFEQVHAAHFVFKGMRVKDIVSWNTMISCLAKSDYVNEALELFSTLHSGGGGGGGLVPDFVTVLSVVQACSNAGSLLQGQMLHGYIVKYGFVHDVSMCNALIIMYAKLGIIYSAEQIFRKMDVKDLVSWNSMIHAYGIHGDGHSALKYFRQLTDVGVHAPNAITYLHVISACSHSGLISEGYKCFESMRKDHGIEPGMDHYACVVDLFGRSGRFTEAEEFIRDMPVPPNSSIWGPLLAACQLHGNVDLAEKAAKELLVLEPDSDIWRVSLSNIYASVGRFKDSTKIRAEMKRVGFKKETGWSFVDVGGVEGYKFVSADTRHRDAEKIYAVWHSMKKHMADVAGDVHKLSLVSVN